MIQDFYFIIFAKIYMNEKYLRMLNYLIAMAEATVIRTVRTDTAMEGMEEDMEEAEAEEDTVVGVAATVCRALERIYRKSIGVGKIYCTRCSY